MSLADRKATARKAAFARRAATRSAAAEAAANAHLTDVLKQLPPGSLSGFWPIRDEIDPRPAMLSSGRTLGLPVVVGRGLPLVFRLWTKDAAMEEAAFGTVIPAEQSEIRPRHVIVPLAAFDAQGMRLGYGGGFYDRTLAALRADGPVTAIGFAFAGQETDALPSEPTDIPLDMVVTENGVRHFAAKRG